MSEAEIAGLAARVPAAELFSWKSPTARARGLRPGSLGDVELIRLMAAEPRLIRRPLTVAGSDVIIGADLKRLEAVR